MKQNIITIISLALCGLMFYVAANNSDYEYNESETKKLIQIAQEHTHKDVTNFDANDITDDDKRAYWDTFIK